MILIHRFSPFLYASYIDEKWESNFFHGWEFVILQYQKIKFQSFYPFALFISRLFAPVCVTNFAALKRLSNVPASVHQPSSSFQVN